MTWVHHCFFCSWHRDATSPTMLDPVCERCGGTLRAIEEADLDRVRREDAEVPNPPGVSRDATGVFAALIIIPWLLPLAGVNLGDLVFAVPTILLVFATERAISAARAHTQWRTAWLAFAAATGVAAGASLFAVVTAVVAGSVGLGVFYLAATASVALLAGAVAIAARALRGARWEGLVDAALLCLVVVALTVYFVITPGFGHGNAALTAVVLIDLAAFVLVLVSAVAIGGSWRRSAAWWLSGGLAVVLVGDSLVAASAANDLGATAALTAFLWALAGYAIAAAAEISIDPRVRTVLVDDTPGRRWMVFRTIQPLIAVLTFPAVALWLHLMGDLPAWGFAFFAAFGVVALVLAFGRQAILLVEHQNNVLRERRLRRDATLRSEELEALTGLATTMTQTLEEAPIVEQALGVLASAARATSAALQTVDEAGAMQLKAATGDWHTERTWAALPTGVQDAAIGATRGGRAILHLPLSARRHLIGTVTLVRGADLPFDDSGVKLLRLLVDEMGVAIQNARDYREKLEQAIRDPLTGLYNRRFFLETLEKEVQRAERYGSEASLVVFDVDDFKQINDTYGHATGDDVLRRIGEVVNAIIRPSDSFARIGGEEFALLLPETPQMEGLLIAERIRTTLGRRKMIPSRRVTVSGGVASCPADTLDPEELQKQADAALYWAKRNGKDRCAVVSEVTLHETDSVSDRALAHLYALVAMIDAAHLHTRDHSDNVASYAVALGQELQLDHERVVRLRRAAMLHDIGKVAVATSILSKPASLTDEEYAQIKMHADVGGRMLDHAGLREEGSWVRAHHERFDGDGYPRRLAGDDIPLEGRILFVADSFEAMTSDRPYSAGRDVPDALAELRACSGTQFDPAVVQALETLVAEDRMMVLALRDTPSSD